jgi:hypothetical protein
MKGRLGRSAASLALGGALLALATPAQAAFPGRNGLLAVQPLKGPGIVLVDANGSGRRMVHATIPVAGCEVCGSSSRLIRPAWSPDGRALLVEGVIVDGMTHVGDEEGLIYPDGSCLDCKFPVGGVDGVFTKNPTLFTVLGGVGRRGSELSEYGIDTLPRRSFILSSSSPMSDPAWSSRGHLAVVHGGWIWAGSLPWLRRLAPGSAPSWSPDGDRLVFVRHGWLMIGRVRGRSFQHLVRGTAPVWSPDGNWIAFFDKRHRLSMVRAVGGRVRRVGTVTGVMADWQPLPAAPPAACRTPPFASAAVLASSNAAIVTENFVEPAQPEPLSSFTLMGCLRADGRERVLDALSNYDGGSTIPGQVLLAGPYAAIIFNYVGKGGEHSELRLFDLRTGNELSNRRIATGYLFGGASIDQVVLGSDGVMAAHTTEVQQVDSVNVTEQIQASDSTGVHTLDSVTEPNGSPTALMNLSLTGDTLTWDHNGAPRSAQLQP